MADRTPEPEEKDKRFSFDDNIVISVFWPPTREYVNDEQYKLMADAGIDLVLSAGDNLGDEEVQMKMAELCEKYGIRMIAAPNGTGSALLGKSDTEIKSLMEKYKDCPSVCGYYILDEPVNPNLYINAYKAMKEQCPYGYMHLNFNPYVVYGSASTYISQMNDWAKLCQEAGYPTEYLMYDLYPFGLEKNSMNRTGFLINLNAARIAGLHNNVKTANYVQSVEQSVAFRSPNREETLYEINMSLAFGIKQLSYFTWFTPHDRSEPFDKGIISKDGVPHEKYEFICELNGYVHNIGRTLIRCDALEVWEGRTRYDAIDTVPEDYFVRFKAREDFTLTYLRDRSDGRNYVMVVNNSFTKERGCSLLFDRDITGEFSFVDPEDGELKKLQLNEDGSLDLTLEAGAAIIIAMPEGFDHSEKNQWNPSDTENLALRSEISCNSSAGNGGWYMNNLNDGDRYGDKTKGWKSEGMKQASVITLTFEKEVTFNRVDVYPCGDVISFGKDAPESYKIYTSEEGKNWTPVNAGISSGDRQEIKKITFGSITSKYLRLECDNADHQISLCEIEVYNDKGGIPDPSLSQKPEEPMGPKPKNFKKGSNIALGKKVTVSSYPATADYKFWGWWPDFLVDGNKSTGWTSNVKANASPDSTEYALIDLDYVYDLSEIKVFPSGCWPKDFEIRVSTDLKEWKVLASEKNSKAPKDHYSCDCGGITARYVLLVGTKLRKTDADGYMLQLGEIEVYGEPH